VIFLDLASEQLAGASMAEISTVLYAKVMQWAGYSRDRKVAYLEFMLVETANLVISRTASNNWPAGHHGMKSGISRSYQTSSPLN
jgi:hypothetical protein